MSSCVASADEADDSRALGEGDQQKTAPGRVAHDDLSVLPYRVVWIVVDPCQRIAEYGESFPERHAVLPKVRRGLCWIPRKSRDHQSQAYHPTIRGRFLDGQRPG